MKAHIIVNIKEINGIAIDKALLKKEHRLSKSADKLISKVTDAIKKYLKDFKIRSDITYTIDYEE